jgi:hypothetical protein
MARAHVTACERYVRKQLVNIRRAGRRLWRPEQPGSVQPGRWAAWGLHNSTVRPTRDSDNAEYVTPTSHLARWESGQTYARKTIRVAWGKVLEWVTKASSLSFRESFGSSAPPSSRKN